MSEEKASFHWFDYVVFVAVLVIALGVGVFQAFTGDRQRTTGEYLTGNRQLRLWPVLLSMFMSGISAIMVLGNSAEMYVYGAQNWVYCVGAGIAYLIAAHLFVPLYWPLKITSVFEYHDKRFASKSLRLFCVFMAILNTLLYMGLALFAPATALEAVTGFPLWGSIVLTGFIAVIYTTVGGIKAVVWTDFFQAFVYFGGLLAVLIAGSIKSGGIVKVWEVAGDAGRLGIFDMNPDPRIRMTFWTASVGGFMTGISYACYFPPVVQRYCSLPTVRLAKTAVYIQSGLYVFTYTLICLCGIVMFAYYDQLGCDPLASGIVDNSNQLLPYFVVDVLNWPGFPGLFVGVLFCGALSSVSSSMNALSAITWKDLLESRLQNLREGRKALITKILVFGYGCIGVLLGYYMQYLTGHVMQIAQSILGGIDGPMCGVVFVGAMFVCGQWKGALIGSVMGICFTSWVNIGQILTNPHRASLPTNTENCTMAPNTTVAPIEEDNMDVYGLYTLSYMLIGFSGWVTSIIAGILYSFVTGRPTPGTVNAKTIIDLGNRCCCCLSPSKQETCWCGADLQIEEEDDISVKERSDSRSSVASWQKDNQEYSVECVVTGDGLIEQTADGLHRRVVTESNGKMPADQYATTSYL